MQLNQLKKLYDEAVDVGLLDAKDYEGFHLYIAEIKRANDGSVK